MGKVIIGMTMSLDGFINDRNGEVSRLYPDLEALDKTDMLQEEIKNTGAVVMGRHAFNMADDPDWFAGNYEFQVPILVLTHTPPAIHPKETDRLKIIFVTDGIRGAVRQAREWAGSKDVMVIGGASTFQQCIDADLYDEIRIGIMPVLLGSGLRLFDNIDTKQVSLEKMKVIESTSGRTDIIFRVKK